MTINIIWSECINHLPVVLIEQQVVGTCKMQLVFLKTPKMPVPVSITVYKKIINNGICVHHLKREITLLKADNNLCLQTVIVHILSLKNFLYMHPMATHLSNVFMIMDDINSKKQFWSMCIQNPNIKKDVGLLTISKSS